MDKKQITNKETLYKMVRELLAKFCDECGSNYQKDDIRIIQKDRNAILTHLSCKNCGKTHLATIFKPLGVSNRIPIKTDLRPEEIQKFAGGRSVSNDDILDIYEWTKSVKSERTNVSKLRRLIKS